MRFLQKICVFLAALAITGCVSVPPQIQGTKATSKQDSYAKTFPKRADKATVYIYRANYVGKIFFLTVSANDIQVGGIPGYGFFALELPSGSYTLKTKADKDAELKIDVAAGNSYYIWLDMSFGMLMGNPDFRIVNEKEAQPVILDECSMVTSSTFPNVAP
ncbi:DUF2846 domain-containing protein [Uliginosibacterium gangwonense]|uniref:DUF2846 domain-containing protein n=1 Tax=Uliginosibacterium gangwonense TaxID=392736 RepID=UPI0003736C92|nr:DUF2846 domain-containing protein [Uliginosibacterium gangwonense]